MFTKKLDENEPDLTLPLMLFQSSVRSRNVIRIGRKREKEKRRRKRDF